MLRVFIGYDANETVAFHVLAHSIYERASEPVLVSGIRLDQTPMWRERDLKQSTDFSFSRFLVPYLCDYQGIGVFLDCDMLCLTDITKITQFINPKYAVSCTQHNYQPKEDTKFLGALQTKYQKKNWSSCMVFNNAACTKLTPEYVNSAHGLELHQFRWCPEQMVGGIPLQWNWLVGEDGQSGNPLMVHYTKGGPWFPAYRNCDFAELWRAEYDKMIYANPVNGYSKEVIRDDAQTS